MALYAVRENSLICCNYFNDSVASTMAKSFEYFTGTPLKRGESANKRLLKMYGIETQFGKEFQKFEIVKLEPQTWSCDECGAKIVQSKTMTDFDIYSPDGDLMGSVYKFGLQDAMFAAKLITEGHCPVCEEWSTGASDFCSKNGWGVNKNFFIDMHRIDRLSPEKLAEYTVEQPPFWLRRNRLM